MRWLAILGAAVCCAAVSWSASAQEVMTTVTPARLLEELRAEGVEARLKDFHGDTRISAYWRDFSYEIIFYFCDPYDSGADASPNSECEDFQFLSTFSGFTGTTDDINEFNRGERFGKVVLYEDGTIGVFYVATFKGGVTSSVFPAHVEWWDTIMENFVEFLEGHT